MGWLLATLVLAQPIVDGDSDCPGPTQVADRLPTGFAYRLQINRAAGALRIELTGIDGRTIGVRYLEATGSCDELADAVAVIVTAWTAPVAAPPALPHPSVADQTPPPPSSRRVAWEIALGFVGSFAAADFAPGATATALIAPRAGSFALRLGASSFESRTEPLGMGHVVWSRQSFEAGIEHRHTFGGLTLDEHADALAGLLFINGSGFAMPKDDFGFDPGLAAGVRVAGATSIGPWLDVSVRGWLRSEQVHVTAPSANASLPQFEVALSAGMALGTW